MQASDDISANEIPKSVLLKVCKQVLPPQTAIATEAKDALLKSTTVFINYLTTVALDSSEVKGKIGENDVYRALQMMELDSSILQPVREAVLMNQILRKEKRKRKEAGILDGNDNPDEQNDIEDVDVAEPADMDEDENMEQANREFQQQGQDIGYGQGYQ